ncbi:MAG TPA: class I SAM-dependent methyltransferase [Bryobacteraceae bacterium]|jgi:ubiquinone/menaquinone biosynthesis C-methylase UbiE|nr:class I SAM-dependent methyltransferase [Bryobacteraceae bacterium]
MLRETGSTLASDPIVEFFDRRAAEYDREYNDQTAGGYALRIRRKKVLDLFDQPGGNVLDVGCGPAVMTQDMLDRGCRFWGVDPSAQMIEICRRRFQESERVHFLRGDAQRLQLPDNFFDAVLCMGVIDSLTDRPLAVREMLRVLKPAGTLIITFTNICSPYAWWKNFMFYPVVRAWHEWRARKGDPTLNPSRRRSGKTRVLYSRRAACEFLRAEGTEVVQVVGYYYNVVFSPLDELLRSTGLWLTQKLEEGRWRTPEWIAVGMIIKARKGSS